MMCSGTNAQYWHWVGDCVETLLGYLYITFETNKHKQWNLPNWKKELLKTLQWCIERGVYRILRDEGIDPITETGLTIVYSTGRDAKRKVEEDMEKAKSSTRRGCWGGLCADGSA